MQALLNTLKALDPLSADFQWIHRYAIGSKGPTHLTSFRIETIYELATAPLSLDLGSTHMLFHGSFHEHIPNILMKGLVVNPKGAKKTGSNFGNGIYMSPSCYESLGYSRAGVGEKAYIFVCHTSLGSCGMVRRKLRMEKSTLPDGLHSLHALGRYAAEETSHFLLPNGATVPAGPFWEQIPGELGVATDIDYDEYVVFDERQIRLAYLLEVTRTG